MEKHQKLGLMELKIVLWYFCLFCFIYAVRVNFFALAK